jgi:Transposase
MFQGRNACREYTRKTTKLQDRHIEHVLKENDSVLLCDITNLVGLPISCWTVARRRSEKGMGSFIAAQKPGLRAENVAKRLVWANQYKDWTIDDWKRVIWSDESSIWIGVNLRRQWVIHPQEERLNPKYVKKTFKGEKVKVMVWACFTGERLGPLIVCDEESIGGDEYEDILRWIVLPD